MFLYIYSKLLGKCHGAQLTPNYLQCPHHLTSWIEKQEYQHSKNIYTFYFWYICFSRYTSLKKNNNDNQKIYKISLPLIFVFSSSTKPSPFTNSDVQMKQFSLSFTHFVVPSCHSVFWDHQCLVDDCGFSVS